jgi:Cu(I)/Ag(I) efflux system membrane fusion protein
MSNVLISIAVMCLMIFGLMAQHSGSHSKHEEMHKTEKAQVHKIDTNVPAEFRTQLSAALEIYFDLKDAMVASESKDALEKAVSFNEALKKVDSDLLNEEMQSRWDMQIAALLKAVKELESKKDITNQRAAFFDISEALITVVKSYGPFDKAVYVQHCPMAFNNKGGDWLSDSKKILNPYYGDTMLHCGSITETIAQQEVNESFEK